MSKIYKKPPHCKDYEDHEKYLRRITKTLYYGKLPKTDMLSLPATELAAEIFSETQKRKSLNRLHLNTASEISRNACVSPCSLVLALVYFERLKKCNLDYLEKTAPSDLFLVSLMVSAKFLFDDGEIDEVFMDEWAASSGMTSRELIQLEREFLTAINWDLYISELLFWKKLHEIEIHLAIKQGTMRGFFTYTELEILAKIVATNFQDLLKCIVAVSVVLAAVYTTAVLMLYGSVAISSTIPGTILYKQPILSIEKSNLRNSTTTTVKKYETPVNVKIIHENDSTLIGKNRSGFNAVKVLKASILLASIKTDNYSSNVLDIPLKASTNSETVTWDWWNIPIMNWLNKISDYINEFEIPAIPIFSSLIHLENKIIQEKIAGAEDNMKMSIKTRIQDQLERSWHSEWTDIIKFNIVAFLKFLF